MANPEHVAIVKQGAEAIAEWRRKNPGAGMDLRRANLSWADLGEANLTEAKLTLANLSGAYLSEANLTLAKLTSANLSGAKLTLANLTLANLTLANLSGANLTLANLTLADLSRANLSEATVGFTTFTRCDLSESKGLESVKHINTSSIDIDTLIESQANLPREFLLGAGVPASLIDLLPQITAGIKYENCFFCYGEPDLDFAKRLYSDLEGEGVPRWMYLFDSTLGVKTWKEIGERRSGSGKIIILCSSKALVRDGVLKEIEDQIDEDVEKMVPVSLDNLWREQGFRVMRGQRDLKPFLIDRNYADFSDPSKYDENFKKLLKALRVKH